MSIFNNENEKIKINIEELLARVEMNEMGITMIVGGEEQFINSEDLFYKIKIEEILETNYIIETCGIEIILENESILLYI